MAIGNIAARYLSSLEETDTTTTTTTTSNVLQPSNRLNSPTKFNRKSLDNNSQDLDALARALNITQVNRRLLLPSQKALQHHY